MRRALFACLFVCLIEAACNRKAPEAHYETSPADRGAVVARVTASGTLSALVTVQVGSQVSGRISQISVDFNSPVKKGQIIARIDPLLFETALDQARANVFASNAAVDKARAQEADAARQLRRAGELFAKNLVAQADVDTAQANEDGAKAQIEAARGQVEQARAQVRQAEVNLGYTRIVSPIDGTVIQRNVDVGQTVASALQAPTLFTIAEDLRQMQVDTNVAEADVGKIAAGMHTSFTVDAYPGERFSGLVRQIRNAPQTVQNVVTYDAVIDVANPELKLKPGMTANVTFVYAKRDDVLRVPNAALRFRPRAPEGAPQRRGPRVEGDAETRTVYVLKGGAPSGVAIKTGVTDGSMTEVVSGELKPGDALVTEAVGGPSGGGPPPMRRLF